MPRGKARILDIRFAQENLEELVDALKPGEWFIIAVNGRTAVKAIALTEEEIEQLSKT